MFDLALYGRARPSARATTGAAALLIARARAARGGNSAASSGSYGFPQTTHDDNATSTVWVDANRSAAVDAFEKADPHVKLNLVSYDGSADASHPFQTKVQLFDRSNSGRSDVLFSAQNDDAARASQGSEGKQAAAAVLDRALMPKSALDNFTPGLLNPRTVDGKVGTPITSGTTATAACSAPSSRKRTPTRCC